MKPALVAKKITSWYAWAGLVFITICGPIAYFSLFYQFIAGSLDAEAEITGNVVTQLISKNPEMWTYEQLRLQEVLSRRHVDHLEMRRIVDTKNRVIAEAFDVLKPPVIMRSADLWDSGVVVARLEISRSMRPLLMRTGIVALLSLLLGMITFIPFMVLPLRAIRRAEDESRASEEKYRNLFDSTTDGVYQVNAEGVFTMMNKAGAKIFGYENPDEIIGHNALEYWREPRDRDAYRAELQIKKVVHAYPISARRKDGEPIELESSSRILEDGAGQFIGIEGILRDVTERMRLAAQLKSLSLTDELTGLYNRRGFFTLGEHLLKMADRTKKGMFLLYADLDGLKEINDTFGHQEGDRALIEAATLLKQTYRKSDVIARLGGDEFAIIPVGFAGNDVEVIAARLQRRLDIHNSRMNRGYKLSMSIGIVFCDPDKPCSLDDLLALADELMYEQKSKRKEQNI